MSKSGNSIVNKIRMYIHYLWLYIAPYGRFTAGVGRAADTGLGYVPVYLGPTIMARFMVYGHAQIILISKQLHLIHPSLIFCHPDMAKVHLSVLLQQSF